MGAPVAEAFHVYEEVCHRGGGGDEEGTDHRPIQKVANVRCRG